MPKTKKRAVSRRADRIEKAHSTELPEAKLASPRSRVAKSKRPQARGVARYPWATSFLIIIIAAGLITIFYTNHLGPFALPVKNQVKSKATTAATVATTPADPAAAFAHATAIATALPALQQEVMSSSPCLTDTIISKITDTSAAPTADEFAKIQHSYSAAPPMSIDTKKVYCAGINTSRGLIVLELIPAWAPQTVNNFVFLAEHKFYDGIVFHRVNQYNGQAQPRMLQTGDPKGDGTGGPGYTIADETVRETYTPGTVAMANTGQPHSSGSQFFINVGDNSSLPKSYNLFGQIVKGLDVAFQIQGPGDDASTKGIKPDIMNHVIVVPAS